MTSEIAVMNQRAVALAERHGFDDRPVVAPAFAAMGALAMWTGEFDEAEGWLRKAWEVAQPDADPAAAVFMHVVTGQLHAANLLFHLVITGFDVTAPEGRVSRFESVQAV